MKLRWLTLQLGPFAILLVTAVYLWVRRDQIPDRFPVHWGIDGIPNGWSTRTPQGVYGPLLFGAALVIGIALLSYAISYSARRPPSARGGPGNGVFAHRIFVVLLGVEFFVVAVLSMVALLPFTGNPGVAPIVILGLAVLAAAIFLSRWLSRGRALSQHLPGGRTPDACWRLGMFYFNPDDPALFVEKRIGIGYTVNFAHASGWIIMALALIIPLGGAFLALSQRK
jgi:uncharacterized membrane protein